MIDTIVLESPFISENVAKKIEAISTVRSGVDFEFNKILYTFTSKELKGSYDSSIRISINREKFVSKLDPYKPKLITVKEESKPYLIIECSLHKFFLGHNIYGGSDDLDYQVQQLILFIEDQFIVELPLYTDFIVRRIDYARVYNLGDNISNFFEGFSNVYYPRRSCQKYGNTGLYFPGSYTTLKLYDKGQEFKKHDKKRLIHFLEPKKLIDLQNIADGKLRIELEIKARKLKHLYNDNLPTVEQIRIADLIAQFNVEVKRVFKLGEDNMKIYNNALEVENVLMSDYGSSGSIYLGTWYRISINGYDKVKNQMPKSTFYRHIDKLKASGVTWNHTDVILRENKVINFVFNPITTNLEETTDLIAC